MDSLFDDVPGDSKSLADTHIPLAERMRPQLLDHIAGQKHLLGNDGPLRAFLENRDIPSMILWGPPGTGKTTLARVIANTLDVVLERLSAIEAGVKDLREALKRADHHLKRGKRTIMFIDEIHRFNKSQQDALLHAVESGLIILIGATTENPSFEVNNALLSRCQVYRLEPLTESDIQLIVERALNTDIVLQKLKVFVDDWQALATVSAGDARTALNAIESAVNIAIADEAGALHITADVLRTVVQQTIPRYDKDGDQHYNTISAFIKSMRGSDPDAALIYLALMIEAGEDSLFICRRMIVFASEDIGNADPQALQVAVNVFLAVERIGMPEGRIVLGQGVTYLATAPKSNASYVAIDAALNIVRSGRGLTIPMHLRNAPTSLMKEAGFGMGYQYPHDAPGHFINVSYAPEEVRDTLLYRPDGQGYEEKIVEQLRAWRPDRYKV